ncbi:hypothetical protein [Streptacidiphilus carbonis]|jgi:hypothetical protein|uniref:hypothetical protein n=1 Tax=Streptacidiphilus carbonis TaxID=105422 RepID=UPI0006941AE0|nr:hypothetical protein [Streptacidiphilus carbonis]
MAARHVRTRRPSAARTAASARCRAAARGLTRAGSRSRAACPPAPTLLGVVTCREDFEALRRDGGTEYTCYTEYLADIEELLGRLREAGGVVRGRAFHPADLVDFCRSRGLSLADPQSHTVYTADPDAEDEWVLYEGEPVAEFTSRLARARERGLVHRRLARMLSETAEAAATGGEFPEDQLHAAYTRGADALRRVLVGAGQGRFRLVCSLRSPEGPVEAWADLLLQEGEDGGSVLRIEEADLDLLCSLLCAGFALGMPGGVVLSGTCRTRGSVAWGWELDVAGFVPRNAADVLLDLSVPAVSWIAVCLPGAEAVPGFALGEISLG